MEISQRLYVAKKQTTACSVNSCVAPSIVSFIVMVVPSKSHCFLILVLLAYFRRANHHLDHLGLILRGNDSWTRTTSRNLRYILWDVDLKLSYVLMALVAVSFGALCIQSQRVSRIPHSQHCLMSSRDRHFCLSLLPFLQPSPVLSQALRHRNPRQLTRRACQVVFRPPPPPNPLRKILRQVHL